MYKFFLSIILTVAFSATFTTALPVSLSAQNAAVQNVAVPNVTVQQKMATLSGNVNDFYNKKPDIIYTGLSSEIYNDRDITVEPDASGNFSLKIPLDKPAYFKVGRNTIYLRPGDSLYLKLSGSALKTQISGQIQISGMTQISGNTQITGTLSEFSLSTTQLNNYLKEPDWLGGSKFYVDNFNSTYEKVGQMIDSLAKIRIAHLEKLNPDKSFSEMDKSFLEMERARITADIISARFAWFGYGKYVEWNAPDSVKKEKRKEFYRSISSDINSFLKTLVCNDNLLDVENVRKLLLECVEYDFFEKSHSDKFKELCSVVALNKMMDRGLLRKDYETLKSAIQTISDSGLKKALAGRFVKRESMMEGVDAMDFSITDLHGKEFKLSDFKGKPLYIDLWATWCIPCLAQSPKFNELSSKYKNITFVAISVDQDRDKWLKKIESDKEKTGTDKEIIESENSVNKKEFITDIYKIRKIWEVESIPRFILIDKDFRIITAFAPRPSDKVEIEKLLEKVNLVN